MAVTVIVNHLTAVHQASNGLAMSAPPDVCKTPGPGGTPPIPYPNLAKSADLVLGTMTVSADGASVAVKDSMFGISTGDEPGTAGGVISLIFKGPAKFANYSMDVKFEGRNVARLGDPMLMNGNQSNTMCGGEVQENLIKLFGQEVYDMLCKAFCFCNELGEGGADVGSEIVQPW